MISYFASAVLIIFISFLTEVFADCYAANTTQWWCNYSEKCGLKKKHKIQR